MDKIGGLFIYHATKPGNYQEKNQSQKAKKITVKRLIRSYLCDQERSRCVVTRRCECLDVCQYGQQYIQSTKNEDTHNE